MPEIKLRMSAPQEFHEDIAESLVSALGQLGLAAENASSKIEGTIPVVKSSSDAASKAIENSASRVKDDMVNIAHIYNGLKDVFNQQSEAFQEAYKHRFGSIEKQYAEIEQGIKEGRFTAKSSRASRFISSAQEILNQMQEDVWTEAGKEAIESTKRRVSAIKGTITKAKAKLPDSDFTLIDSKFSELEERSKNLGNSGIPESDRIAAFNEEIDAMIKKISELISKIKESVSEISTLSDETIKVSDRAASRTSRKNETDDQEKSEEKKVEQLTIDQVEQVVENKVSRKESSEEEPRKEDKPVINVPPLPRSASGNIPPAQTPPPPPPSGGGDDGEPPSKPQSPDGNLQNATESTKAIAELSKMFSELGATSSQVEKRVADLIAKLKEAGFDTENLKITSVAQSGDVGAFSVSASDKEKGRSIVLAQSYRKEEVSNETGMTAEEMQEEGISAIMNEEGSKLSTVFSDIAVKLTENGEAAAKELDRIAKEAAKLANDQMLLRAKIQKFQSKSDSELGEESETSIAARSLLERVASSTNNPKDSDYIKNLEAELAVLETHFSTLNASAKKDLGFDTLSKMADKVNDINSNLKILKSNYAAMGREAPAEIDEALDKINNYIGPDGKILSSVTGDDRVDKYNEIIDLSKSIVRSYREEQAAAKVTARQEAEEADRKANAFKKLEEQYKRYVKAMTEYNKAVMSGDTTAQDEWKKEAGKASNYYNKLRGGIKRDFGSGDPYQNALLKARAQERYASDIQTKTSLSGAITEYVAKYQKELNSLDGKVSDTTLENLKASLESIGKSDSFEKLKKSIDEFTAKVVEARKEVQTLAEEKKNEKSFRNMTVMANKYLNKLNEYEKEYAGLGRTDENINPLREQINNFIAGGVQDNNAEELARIKEAYDKIASSIRIVRKEESARRADLAKDKADETRSRAADKLRFNQIQQAKSLMTRLDKAGYDYEQMGIESPESIAQLKQNLQGFIDGETTQDFSTLKSNFNDIIASLKSQQLEYKRAQDAAKAKADSEASAAEKSAEAQKENEKALSEIDKAYLEYEKHASNADKYYASGDEARRAEEERMAKEAEIAYNNAVQRSAIPVEQTAAERYASSDARAIELAKAIDKERKNLQKGFDSIADSGLEKEYLDSIKTGIEDLGNVTTFEDLKAKAAELREELQMINEALDNADDASASEKRLSVNELRKGNAEKRFLSFSDRYDKSGIADVVGTESGVSESVSEAIAKVEELQEAYDALKNTNPGDDGFSNVLSDYNIKLAEADAALKAFNLEKKEIDTKNMLTGQVPILGEQISIFDKIKVPPMLAETIANIRKEYEDFKESLASGNIVKAESEFNSLTSNISNANDALKTINSTQGTFNLGLVDMAKRLLGLASPFMVFQKARSIIKQMVTNVTEVDTAMINLKKVVDASETAFAKFQARAGATAKEIGSSISGYIEAVDVFAKMGESLESSEELGKVATVFSNVGDFGNVENAANVLVSAMKAFNISTQDAQGVADRLNEVANKYAVTAEEVSEGLERSASALAAGGNDIDQSIAMITTIAEITRDASAAGSALKVLSLRLRGAKVELEDAGESTDGMAESTSKLRSKILALTNVNGKGGFDIMKDANTFKSTYDIMQGIAEVWQDISDVDQAALLELIAGKVRSNQVAALLNNMSRANDVLATSMNSEGSIYEENSRWLDSIEAKQKQFTASWQDLSQTVVNSDIVKFTYDSGSGILGFLNDITKFFGSGSLLAGGLAAFSANKLGIFGLGGNSKKQSIDVFERYNQLLGENGSDGAAAFTQLNKELKDVGKSLSNVDAQIIATAGNSQIATDTMSIGFAKAKVAAKALGAALKTALVSTIITLAVSFIISAISDLINAEQEAIDKAKDMAEEWNNTAKDLNDTSKSIKSLETEFSELGKGVDVNGNNISLTTDEYKRYKDICNEIAGILPNMVAYYDAEGNAVLRTKDSVEALNDELERTQNLEYNKILAESDKTLGTLTKKFDKEKTIVFNNRDQYNPIEYGSAVVYSAFDDYAKYGNGISDETALTIVTRMTDEYIDDVVLAREYIAEHDAEIRQEYSRLVSEYSDLNNAGRNALVAALNVGNYDLSDEQYSVAQRIVGTIVPTETEGVFDSYAHMMKFLEQGIIAPIKDGNIALEINKALDTQAKVISGDNVVGAIIDAYDGVRESIANFDPFAQETILSMFDINGINNGLHTLATKMGNTTEEEIAPVMERLANVLTMKDINILNSLPKEVWETGGFGGGAVDTIEEVIAVLDDAKSKIAELAETIQGSFNKTAESAKTVAEVMKEVGVNGAITKEQYDKLIAANAEFADAIDNSTGYLTLNYDKMQDIIQAQYEEQKAQVATNKAINMAKYKENTKEIIRLEKEMKGLTKGTEEYNEMAAKQEALMSENEGIRNEIRDLDILTDALDYATSAYKRWLDARESPEYSDEFTSLKDAIDDVKEGLDTGKIGTRKFRTAMELLFGEDWEEQFNSDYSKIKSSVDEMSEYFTEDASGMQRGIDKLYKGGFFGKNGDKYFVNQNKTIEDAMELLGLSRESTIMFFNALRDYGWKINIPDEDTETAIDANEIDKKMQTYNEAKAEYDRLVSEYDPETATIEQTKELTEAYSKMTEAKNDLINSDAAFSGVFDQMEVSDIESAKNAIAEIQTALEKLEAALASGDKSVIAQTIAEINSLIDAAGGEGAHVSITMDADGNLIPTLNEEGFTWIKKSLEDGSMSAEDAIAIIGNFEGDLKDNLSLVKTILSGTAKNAPEQTIKFIAENSDLFNNDIDFLKSILSQTAETAPSSTINFIAKNSDLFNEDMEFIKSILGKTAGTDPEKTINFIAKNSDLFNEDVEFIKSILGQTAETAPYATVRFIAVNSDLFNNDIDFLKSLLKQTAKEAPEQTVKFIAENSDLFNNDVEFLKSVLSQTVNTAPEQTIKFIAENSDLFNNDVEFLKSILKQTAKKVPEQTIRFIAENSDLFNEDVDFIKSVLSQTANEAPEQTIRFIAENTKLFESDVDFIKSILDTTKGTANEATIKFISDNGDLFKGDKDWLEDLLKTKVLIVDGYIVWHSTDDPSDEAPTKEKTEMLLQKGWIPLYEESALNAQVVSTEHGNMVVTPFYNEDGEEKAMSPTELAEYIDGLGDTFEEIIEKDRVENGGKGIILSSSSLTVEEAELIRDTINETLSNGSKKFNASAYIQSQLNGNVDISSPGVSAAAYTFKGLGNFIIDKNNGMTPGELNEYLHSLGSTIDEILANDKNGKGIIIHASSLEEPIENLADLASMINEINEGASITVSINTEGAEKKLIEFIGIKRTIDVGVSFSEEDGEVNNFASGTKNAPRGASLVGEGVKNGKYQPEIVIKKKTGEYFLADHPQLVNLERGDQVLNGEETKRALRGRKSTSGRAYSFGTGAQKSYLLSDAGVKEIIDAIGDDLEASGKDPKSSNKGNGNGGNTKSLKWLENLVDWIPRALEVMKKKTADYVRMAEKVISYVSKNTELDYAIENVYEEIDLTKRAYDRYMRQADEIAAYTELSADIIDKIRNGTIDIEQYDKKTRDYISEYQKWFEKAVALESTLESLEDQLTTLAKQKLTNITSEFESLRSIISGSIDLFSQYIEEAKAFGGEIFADDYKEMLEYSEEQITNIRDERNALADELQNLMNVGLVRYGDEIWREYTEKIIGLDKELSSAVVSMQEFKDEVANIPVNNIEIIRKYVSNIQSNLDDISNLWSSQGKKERESMYRMMIDNTYDEIAALENENMLLIDQQKDLDVLSEKYQELQDKIDENNHSIMEAKSNQEEWNDKIIDATIARLQDQNDEYEKSINLMDALNGLETARQRRANIYRDNIGFVYEADKDEIKSAQKAVSDIVFDTIIDDLESSKENSNIYDDFGNLIAVDTGLTGIDFSKYYDSISTGTENSKLLTSVLSAIDYAKIMSDAAAGNVEIDLSNMTLNNVDSVQELSDAIINYLPNYLLQYLYSKE